LKSEGKQFEKDFEDSCKKTDYYLLRLIDSVKWGQGEGSKFTPSNKCDSILFTIPFLWMLELKSTIGTSMSFNPYVEKDGEVISAPWIKPENEKTKFMIKHNQVKSLMKMESEGLTPGFIFNFRERILKTKSTPNQTYFVHIKDFIEYTKQSETSSINAQICKDIGVELEGYKKKVYYTYNIKEFVIKAIKFYTDKKYINSKYHFL